MTFEELEVLIKDNFETFMADGFDINSDKSLNDLFFVLFKQVVLPIIFPYKFLYSLQF